MPTTLVQSKKNTGNHVIAMTGVTAGNGLVVNFVSNGNATDHVTSITDTQLNTWVHATGSNGTTGEASGSYADCWYCAAALASGACTITIHCTNNGPSNAYAYELQGTVTFVTANATNAIGVNATPVVLTSPSINAPDALFVSTAAQQQTITTPTVNSPFVLGTYIGGSDQGPTAEAVGAGPLSAVFTFPVNWNNTTSKAWVANIAAFSAASAPVLTTIVITPSSATILAGATQTFTAQAFDQFGAPFVTTFTWHSSNTVVATIATSGATTGLASGLVVGTSNITATSGAVTSNTAVLTVTSPGCTRQIVGGGFQDALGNSLNGGYMTWRLNTDASNSCLQQINANQIVTVPLDASGNVSGVVFIHTNNSMTPTNTIYVVTVYTAQGQPVWKQEITVNSGVGPLSLA